MIAVKIFTLLLVSYFYCTSSVKQAQLDCDPFVLHTNALPKDHRLLAGVANGHVGTIIYHAVFHTNGFYNGNTTNSTYAKVPNPIAFWINDSGFQMERTYNLDLYNGVFTENILNEKFHISTRFYAHQYYKTVMAVDLEITKTSTVDEELKFFLTPLGLNLVEVDDIKILEEWKNETYSFFKITSLIPEIDSITGPNVTIINTNLPDFVEIGKNDKQAMFTFLFTVTVNDDENGWYDFRNAQQLADNGSLFALHKSAWNKLWNEGGRIDIEGNCSFAQTVHASFYYILSSLPMQTDNSHEWPFFGICPSSLAQLDIYDEMYWGHVFWDQETWMLPPIQIFYPNVIKRILIDSRIRNLNGALEKAKSFGYNGSMYPWESAYTGLDTSNWSPAVLREIHITGDIALGMQQYLHYTGDKQFILTDGAYQVFFEIATFWASRVNYQPERQMYGVFDVMGPDEHHDHVNNSAYTNVIAQISLRLPDEIYKTYISANGLEANFPKPNPSWLDIADKMYIPFDSNKDYHPEFDGYNTSEMIKQADVVLLGYPLMFQMTEDVRRNDLAIYENVTSPDGPAMTWAMHAIGWLEVDEPEQADILFQKNFAYVKEPFKIWTENAQKFDGAINFVTGMGGFLQSILNGYFGIRIYQDKFEFKPYPIPNTNAYTIKSMKYLGNVFSARVTKDILNLTVVLAESNFCIQQIPSGNVMPFMSYEKLPLGKYSIAICSNETVAQSLSHAGVIVLLILVVNYLQ